MLEEYLDIMTTGLLNNKATVDKYIGDAIMAFWGAPRKIDNHAKLACNSALENLKSLKVLNNRWKERSWEEIDLRIGINTGDALVGNFGCSSRLDYTAIGDSVNLASRLENVNKVYGTKILVTKETKDQAGEDFTFIFLDKISVQGKEETTSIYELVDLSKNIKKADLLFLDLYSKGLKLYFSQNWEEAESYWQQCLQIRTNDLASKVMIERCLDLKNTYIENWDGTNKLTSK
jgi:adenylate cyclase